MSGLVPGLQNQLERFDSASDLPKSSGYPTGIRIFLPLKIQSCGLFFEQKIIGVNRVKIGFNRCFCYAALLCIPPSFFLLTSSLKKWGFFIALIDK